MMSRSSLFFLTAALILAGCGGGSKDAAQTDSKSSAASGDAAAQSPVDAATAATVTGSVKFTGAKPKAQKISMAADAYCKTQHATVDSEQVVVNANNTLKNVYVYVKSGLPADMKFPAPSETVVFDQKGCMYTPHVAGVMVGQTLTVRNSDSVLHNVNARPKNNPPFNFGQPTAGMENKKTFQNPEISIPVKCDVHPWMSALIHVQNHPYFGVTGDDGSFSLKNLPPGTYVLEAVHEKFGTATQNVTVGAKESKTVDFSFKGA